MSRAALSIIVLLTLPVFAETVSVTSENVTTLPLKDANQIKVINPSGKVTIANQYQGESCQNGEFKIIGKYRGDQIGEFEVTMDSQTATVAVTKPGSKVVSGSIVVNKTGGLSVNGNIIGGNTVITGNKVTINGQEVPPGEYGNPGRLDLIVLIPEEGIRSATVESQRQGINIGPIAGMVNMNLSTKDGSITYLGGSGDLTLRTRDGSIFMTNHQSGKLSLYSQDGHVTVNNHQSGHINAETGSGNIFLTNVNCHEVSTDSKEEGDVHCISNGN